MDKKILLVNDSVHATFKVAIEPFAPLQIAVVARGRVYENILKLSGPAILGMGWP